MSDSAPPQPSNEQHAPGRVKRISDALNHALDVLHIHHHDDRPPCALAEALLARVKEDMGASWTQVEADFCDPACLQRYLRARSMDVTKAATMLKNTLEWRREFEIDKLKLSDYEDFLGEGWVYLLGNDDQGHTAMMLRKRATRLEDDRIDNFVGYLVVLLESAIRNMKGGQETWTWIFDMKGYESRNSPRFDYTLRVLQLVANHYPERLNKVFIMDAPTIFWVLFKAVCPFLDPVTKSKVEFVYSKDIPKQQPADEAPSKAEAATGTAEDAAVVVAAPAVAADTPVARFMPLHKYYAAKYDKQQHTQMLAALGWPQ